MTVATTVSGRRVYVRIGDGNSPETFSHRCSMNGERSLALTVETGKVVVPDCDNPEAPGWPATIKTVISAAISGEGVVHIPDLAFFYAMIIEEGSRNFEIAIVDSSDTVLAQWDGRFHITSFVPTGPQDGLLTMQMAAESDGPLSKVV